MINPGVVAAIRVVGVRGTWILNSVFFKKFKKNFKLFSNFNEVQTYSLMMIC